MTTNNNKGFTLIEIVTTIVVLGILGTFTFSFLQNAVRTYVLVREQDALYSDGTYIMERITRELSDATTVSSPVAESTSSTLTFDKAHPTTIDTAITVTFTKSGRNLLRNTIPISRNIKTFSVTRSLPAGALNEAITIELELDSQRDTSIPVFSVKTTITPYNYGTGYTGRSFNGDYYENIK